MALPDHPSRSRRVGLGLGLGILLVPGIFAWFTLRSGHTRAARAVAFGWLIVGTVGGVVVFAEALHFSWLMLTGRIPGR